MILRFIIIGLTSYRLTRFITTDTIPFGFVRTKLMERWGGAWVEGLTCSWCIGAWISFALVAGLAQIISIPLPAIYALAVSTVVGIVGRYTED